MFVLGEEVTQEITAVLETDSVMWAGVANRETAVDLGDDHTV
ncbi:hypothetical protein OG205_02810 [Lentzea sp. NBC_00516]|nr:hypothetical protein [Lentzea sp. NBC_00516]WUD25953.1 hypothetical protein OG205_02810 [Lentzea sp. NBC_00516]